MASAQAKQMVERAFDALVAAVEAGKSEQLRAYLAMLGRFHSYSPGNVLLICTQFPKASRVAGYRAWQRLGRQVRRGAKAIRILAPVVRRRRPDEKDDEHQVVAFKTACVFDVSQTKGEPLAEFAQVSGNPGSYLDRLKKLVADRGIALEYADTIGGADGLSTSGQIVVRAGLDPGEEFSVLVHELAHVMLHHGASSALQTRKTCETEAEGVAFVVCQAVGLDTNSAASDYIQLYQGDRKTLLASLERIQRTAGGIIKDLMSERRAKLPARPQTQARIMHRSLFDSM